MSNVEKGKVKEFYTNDIVYRVDKNKRINLGVIIDCYEAATELDDNDPLEKGQIRLMWSHNSREQVLNCNKVRLMNRSIIPGDIVRRLVKGKETQRGYCKETKQIATVQIVGTDKVIEAVDSKRLHNVRRFDIEDAVCLGDKYGRIEDVVQTVSMQSKCGSVVDLFCGVNQELDDYWLNKRSKLPYVTHYPGQEVICVPANFESPVWVKKSKSMKRNMQSRQRFTIQNVEYYQIEVAWYVNPNTMQISDLTSEEIQKLKVIEHPSDSCLELNERRLLKLSSNDVLLKRKDWSKKLSMMVRPDAKVRHIVNAGPKSVTRMPKIRTNSTYACVEGSDVDEDWWTEDSDESDNENDCSTASSRSPSQTKFKKRHFPPKPKELVPGSTLPVEIMCVESKITVVWQDGTEENDIPSTQLYYSISLDDHEFFPGEWVVKDVKGEVDDGSYGVVQQVNCLERTALVKWFKYSDETKTATPLTAIEISVYDLKKHSKFVFKPGSIVRANPTTSEKMGKVVDSCVEGYVQVEWLDHSIENCTPQQIELLTDGDYDYSSDYSDSSHEVSSWDTESIESYVGDVNDETALQNMAARLDFVRSRIVYLKEAFKQHTITENFSFLKDLLQVYDNSSYLDKLLGTDFFSLKSRHFQALLMQAKEKAKSLGVELRGRLFSNDNTFAVKSNIKDVKVAEKENISRMIKLEHRINAEIEKKDGIVKTPTTPLTPNSSGLINISQENLCIELLSMLKMRMDLVYAEIISRIGGTQAFTVLTKASELSLTPLHSTPLPSVPITPDDSFVASNPLKALLPESKSQTNTESQSHIMAEDAFTSHFYYSNKFEPNDLSKFLKAVQKEYKSLKESLPPGVWVKSYSNRIDLLSVMIKGPAKTPYEDGLFLFDIQLSQDYPRSPPVVHYISYSSERLNPNLYVEGKVCVSLLGTWLGKGTEVWGPNSTLLQLIVSIQGLILVSEPYYNEAGYEKQTDTQQGYENSRTYNELVILKMVQSMTEMLLSPPDAFKDEVLNHFKTVGKDFCDRLERYCSDSDSLTPEFPLLPVSKGLKLSLSASLNSFQDVLKKVSDYNQSK